MTIKYITNVRLPTPRAQGYAIMKMCEQFVKAGTKVELYVPERKNLQHGEDPFEFYKIEKNFVLNKIESSDFLGKTQKFGRMFYWIDLLSFYFGVRSKIKMEAGEWVYSRDYLTTLFFPKGRVMLEIHDIPTFKTLFKMAIKRAKLFFVLNQNLKDDLVKMGVMKDKIFIFPSGVELKDFDIDISKEEAREKLDLPKDKNIVVYTGHLYSWKGVETLALTAKEMADTIFVFVGGVPPELSKFTLKYKDYKNIIVRPSAPRHLMPIYLKAGDVLSLPNSSKEEISARYTSPLKLLEYMASKRPIVASKLSSVLELVSDQECFFAEPDNPESFAVAIRNILANPELALTVAQKAYEKVQKYNWADRAKNILRTMESKTSYSR